ncbi:23S rRNA pseudouridine2457 synthase [Cyclobacterium lianum]|uniref:Pseudouridine synthase n=1 Tax=Cyclobacterium lianum TaxID=388280 RepID=A0A1M7HY69_9BACT|nr:pseudouridine synthase [Cyclobacterium lianum]SHM33444.1 23S rRNA pseudouridine2457 synthase [Cyclobacterium lianum]
MEYRYYRIYKPYGTLSQFSGERDTLRTLHNFPDDVYPVGRLDKDSEGLLLLTNDKSLNHRLLDPLHGHKRTYWVQVEGEITTQALQDLEAGVRISINGKPHQTSRASASLAAHAGSVLPEREPPIRFRKHIPETWIALTLTEGKNRQVRKMTAAVGFPTLRLVRWSIEGLTLDGMQVGQVEELKPEILYEALRIPRPANQSGQQKRGKFHKTKKKSRF